MQNRGGRCWRDVGHGRCWKDEAAQAFSRVDILVNNAAMILPEQRTHETSLGDWDRLLAVNLRGPFLEMSPEGGKPPETVVPLAVRLASLPARGPSGKEFVVR